MTHDIDRLITVSIRDFSDIARISRSKIYSMLAARQLDSIKVGRRRLIIVESYYTFINQQLGKTVTMPGEVCPTGTRAVMPTANIEHSAVDRNRRGFRLTSELSAEKRCEEWMRERVLRGERPRTRAEMLAAAKTAFPDLSDRAFGRVWAIVAPDDWKQPGVRKSPRP